MRILTIGLFNWKNAPINHSDIRALASFFLGVDFKESNSIQYGEKGWYVRELNLSDFYEEKNGFFAVKRIARVGLTHSRLIIELKTSAEDSIHNYRELSDLRHNIRTGVKRYVETCIDNMKNSTRSTEWTSDFTKKILSDHEEDFPLPFVFLYQILFVKKINTAIKERFYRYRNHILDAVPFGIETTCFYGSIEDVGKRRKFLLLGKHIVVNMRVSGSTLMVNECSKYLEQKIINLLYLKGLYAISRNNNFNFGLNYVYDSLEPLLEAQGQGIMNELNDTTIQERLVELNNEVMVLTIIIVIVSLITTFLTVILHL